MAQKTVLITGLSGLIGGAVRRRLEGRYDLRALNRRETPGVVCHRADISDLEAIRPAFKGVEAVVHLAAVVSGSAPWGEVLRHNVVGTYNVFEAARQAGVKRIVYASSGSTVAGWEREAPYGALVGGRYGEASEGWTKLTHETPVRPAGLYGCSKVWGGALARHFSDAHGVSAICLRIGAVNREDRPSSPRHFSVWCSQRDVAQMVERCIEAPEAVRFDIFYAVSDNRWSYRDIARARQVVGYEPEDSAERYRQNP